jgi:hypothetical protein
MWYIRDGAPAHFRRAVRNVLSNTYHDRRIGRGGSSTWPPNPSDLNPLNFYLRGPLKTLVYVAPVDNEEVRTSQSPCECLSATPATLNGRSGL